MGLKIASTARAPKNLGSRGRLAKRGPTLMGWSDSQPSVGTATSYPGRTNASSGRGEANAGHFVVSSFVSAEAERVEMTGIVADFRSSLKEEIDAERRAMRPATGDCG